MEYRKEFNFDDDYCYEQLKDKIEKDQRYHQRWYKTMALNLDFYSIPDSINQIIDDILNTKELRETFLHLNNKNNGPLMQSKVLATIRPIILSLFVAWKSGDWCVRYSRGSNHLTNIKNFFYSVNIDGNQTTKIKPNMKPYFDAWNRKFLNKTFNNLELTGFVKQIKGEKMSKTSKKNLQTRVFNQPKLINIFKKYENCIDINKLNYLRNVESLKFKPNNILNKMTQNSITIRDMNKKDILSIIDINKIKTKFGEPHPEIKIDKINNYYNSYLIVKVTGFKDNYDIIKKHKRVDSGVGHIDENGYLIYNNIFMRRIFNNCSLIEGGRIYSNYQNDTKTIRKNFLINEEKTKLFDMQAGQINMLYHLEGIESIHEDAYNLFENYTKLNELSSEFIKQFRKIVKIIILTIINCKNKQQAIYSCWDELKEDLLKLKALKLLCMNKPDDINYSECYIDDTVYDYMSDCENDTPINTLTDIHIDYLEKAKQQVINLQESQSKLEEFNVVKYGNSYGNPTVNYSDRVGFHTIDLIIEAIKEKHSLISKYFASGFGVRLQKQESDVVIDTIITMIDEYNTPILSVHDEIIVQKSLSCQAHDIFIDTYSQKFIFPCVLTDETGEIFNTTQEYRNYQNKLYKSNIDNLLKEITTETKMKTEESPKLTNRPFSLLDFVIPPPINQTAPIIIESEKIIEEELPEEIIKSQEETKPINSVYNNIHDPNRSDYYGMVNEQTILEQEKIIHKEKEKKINDDINNLIASHKNS